MVLVVEEVVTDELMLLLAIFIELRLDVFLGDIGIAVINDDVVATDDIEEEEVATLLPLFNADDETLFALLLLFKTASLLVFK